MKKLLLVCMCVVSYIFGLDVRYCTISNHEKHASNQMILSEILDGETAQLTGKTPLQQACCISGKIKKIAGKILEKGFALDAYRVPEANENSILAFDCFPLWEGDAHGGIPLTFFVYVWPTEEYALQHNSSHPRNRYYGSDIHSHPISCALAVLEGTMVQKNYKLLASHSIDRIVQQVDEEIFQKCEGAVDDLSELFIHQLYAIGNKGNGSKPALSLHVYGLPSEEKVMASFKETSKEHTYNRILEKDGVVKVIPFLPENQ